MVDKCNIGWYTLNVGQNIGNRKEFRMKKVIGYTIFSILAGVCIWGIAKFGPANVLIPGLSASAIGLVLLGCIALIRGERV